MVKFIIGLVIGGLIGYYYGYDKAISERAQRNQDKINIMYEAPNDRAVESVLKQYVMTEAYSSRPLLPP